MVAFWSCFGIFNALIPPLPSKCDNFGIFLDLSKFAIRPTRRQPAGLSPLGFMLSPGFWRPVAARGRCARGILDLRANSTQVEPLSSRPARRLHRLAGRSAWRSHGQVRAGGGRPPDTNPLGPLEFSPSPAPRRLPVDPLRAARRRLVSKKIRAAEWFYLSGTCSNPSDTPPSSHPSPRPTACDASATWCRSSASGTRCCGSP